MAIYVKHDTQRVDIEDIPLSEYAEIHAKTGVHWWQLITSPLNDAKAALMLVQAGCRMMGVPVPDDLSPKQLLEALDVVTGEAANIAEVFNEGIPDPKAAGETATT